MVTKGFRSADDGGGLPKSARACRPTAAPMCAAATAGSTTISAATGLLCPATRRSPAALHAARRPRRPRPLSQHQPRVAAGLRHQRQHAAHLVQPLHRHPREIRPGRPGRSQRHRSTRSSSSIALEFDGNYFNGRWKPRSASTIAPSTGTTWITRASRYRDFLSHFPELTFNGRPLHGRLEEPGHDHRRCSSSSPASITTGSGPTATPTSISVSPVRSPQSWGTDVADRPLRPAPAQSLRARFNLNRSAVASTSTTRSAPSATWRAGALPTCSPTDTKIKGSYGTAFKAPSLFELYGTGFFCAGNRNLQPEYSRGYEFGVEQGMFDRKVEGRHHLLLQHLLAI